MPCKLNWGCRKARFFLKKMTPVRKFLSPIGSPCVLRGPREASSIKSKMAIWPALSASTSCWGLPKQSAGRRRE